MNPINLMAETHCDDTVVVPVVLEHPQVQVSPRTRPSGNEADSLSSDGLVLRFYKTTISPFSPQDLQSTANGFQNKTTIATIVL